MKNPVDFTVRRIFLVVLSSIIRYLFHGLSLIFLLSIIKTNYYGMAFNCTLFFYFC